MKKTHARILRIAAIQMISQVGEIEHNLARALLIYGREEEAEKQMYTSLAGKSSGGENYKYMTHYNLGVYYLYT